jgi:hypothetical protein
MANNNVLLDNTLPLLLISSIQTTLAHSILLFNFYDHLENSSRKMRITLQKYEREQNTKSHDTLQTEQTANRQADSLKMGVNVNHLV